MCPPAASLRNTSAWQRAACSCKCTEASICLSPWESGRRSCHLLSQCGSCHARHRLNPTLGAMLLTVGAISQHPPLPVLWAVSPVAEAFGNGVTSSITTAPPRRCPGAASSPESRTAGPCGLQGMKKNSTGQGSFFLLAISAQGYSSPTRLDMPACPSLQCLGSS